MLTVDPSHDLLSLGKLAEIFQASPRLIERAAAAAQIAASLRLNCIPYFAETDIERIREQVDALRGSD